MIQEALAILLGYALGSLSFAYMIGKLFYRLDIRTKGTKNAGTTNAFQVLGKPAGIATLLGDVAKGFAAIWIAIALAVPELVVYLAGIAAILGHCFPLYFQFKGGKGKATAVGVLFALLLFGEWLRYRNLLIFALIIFFIYPLTRERRRNA